MDVLRDRAQQKLDDTTLQLGKVQQDYSQAVTQQEQLESYQQEYLQKLHNTVASKGMLISDLVNQQSFIDSLCRVVRQHSTHVAACQHSVNQVLVSWRDDRQRLHALDTLKSRADGVQSLKENRKEQKMMDEFAQRASAGKELL